MQNLKGSVTGLSSQDITRAKVDLKANLGYGSPIEISGAVNPLIKDLYADIKISFKDLEMSTVTPYAGRYFGLSDYQRQTAFQCVLPDRQKENSPPKTKFSLIN